MRQCWDWSSSISEKESRRTPNRLFFQAPDRCREKLQCKWARMSCGRQSSGPLRHPPIGAGIHGHHRPPGVNGSQWSHKLNGRLMRWALVLQAYQYAIMYRPRIHHQNADGFRGRVGPRMMTAYSERQVHHQRHQRTRNAEDINKAKIRKSTDSHLEEGVFNGDVEGTSSTMAMTGIGLTHSTVMHKQALIAGMPL